MQLRRKAQFLRAELETYQGVKSRNQGKSSQSDLGTWENAARYLAPEIILRTDSRRRELLWIHVPGVGTFPPDLEAFGEWTETIPHSDGETASDALASLRAKILSLSPDKRKNADKLIRALERLLAAQ